MSFIIVVLFADAENNGLDTIAKSRSVDSVAVYPQVKRRRPNRLFMAVTSADFENGRAQAPDSDQPDPLKQMASFPASTFLLSNWGAYPFH